jgi:hypothetical protein
VVDGQRTRRRRAAGTNHLAVWNEEQEEEQEDHDEDVTHEVDQEDLN